MYGAAVPPPASSSSMHPPVDYGMATVPLAIPPFDYGSVVNGPTMDMVMMGHQGKSYVLGLGKEKNIHTGTGRV